MKFARVTVLGGGGMGTALAWLWALRGANVTLWGRNPERTAEIARTRRNPYHLNDVDFQLPPNILVTSDPAVACHDAQVFVLAIPSAFLRSALRDLAPWIPPEIPLLSVVKGMEKSTFALPCAIALETLGGPSRAHASLSGPSHAEELIHNLPASFVASGREEWFTNAVQESLNQGMLRIYTNTDLIGVELAGALKNVLAIAAGICEGLGLGDNAKAALLTRGLVEIARFAIHQGADRATFYGLAGVGDLLTTCYSRHGRNRHVGLEIGRGRSLADTLAAMGNVAEGVTTASAIAHQAEHIGIEMPICQEVHQILHQGKPPREALADLMLRAPKEEWRL